MKTNETNKLDEILDDMEVDVSLRGHFIRWKAKQQINKWALEKCLKLIKQMVEDNEFDLLVFSMEEHLIDSNVLEERARKEFYE